MDDVTFLSPRPSLNEQQQPREERNDRTSIMKLLMETSTSMLRDNVQNSTHDLLDQVSQKKESPNQSKKSKEKEDRQEDHHSIVTTSPKNVLEGTYHPAETLGLSQGLSTDAAPPILSETLDADIFHHKERPKKGPAGPQGPPGVCVCSLKSGHDSRTGRTVTVDPFYGSDSHGKREARPFRTIDAALAVIMPGDLLFLMPGEYEVLTLKPKITVIASGSVYVRSLSVGNSRHHLGVIIIGVTFVPTDGTLTISGHQSLRFERCSFISRDSTRRGSLIGVSTISSTLEFTFCNFILLGGPNLRAIHINSSSDQVTVLESQVFIESTSSSNIALLEISGDYGDERTYNPTEGTEGSQITEFSHPIYEKIKRPIQTRNPHVDPRISFIRNHVRISHGSGSKIALLVHNGTNSVSNVSFNTFTLEGSGNVESINMGLSFSGRRDQMVIQGNQILCPRGSDLPLQQGLVEMESSIIELSNNVVSQGHFVSGVRGRGVISSDVHLERPLIPFRAISGNTALILSDHRILITTEAMVVITLPRLGEGTISQPLEIKSVREGLGHKIVAAPGDSLEGNILVLILNTKDALRLSSYGRTWYTF